MALSRCGRKVREASVVCEDYCVAVLGKANRVREVSGGCKGYCINMSCCWKKVREVCVGCGGYDGSRNAD